MSRPQRQLSQQEIDARMRVTPVPPPAPPRRGPAAGVVRLPAQRQLTAEQVAARVARAAQRQPQNPTPPHPGVGQVPVEDRDYYAGLWNQPGEVSPVGVQQSPHQVAAAPVPSASRQDAIGYRARSRLRSAAPVAPAPAMMASAPQPATTSTTTVAKSPPVDYPALWGTDAPSEEPSASGAPAPSAGSPVQTQALEPKSAGRGRTRRTRPTESSA